MPWSWVQRYGGAMDHVRWRTRPTLHEPVVIAAFEGWNDAGDAATTAVRYLAERWDAGVVADIDPEEYYDFTTTRPDVRLDEEGQREIVWPATEIHAATIPGGQQDALLIIGTEPQLRWRTYCDQLTTIACDQGARLCITLGALLAEVPHTRPTPIVGTAYEPAVVAGLDLQPSQYEGPTGIVGVLHDAWRRAGLRSASLWATVPAYVPGAPSPKAALALVERAAAMLQTWVPTTDLEIASASYERQVSELVDADEETATYVASLEERHDVNPGQLPTPDSIAEEVERFLRDQ
jgi:proteasome assembly chaperone (PAC2) family protein